MDEYIVNHVKELYDNWGQRKPMGISAPTPEFPHYFLLRPFWNELDLLVILNTHRCRYQCFFCQLPAKCSRDNISEDNIVKQYLFILEEVKHCLSLVERVTLSNEGSVFDFETFPKEALLLIASMTKQLRRVKTFVCETRLEFVEPGAVKEIRSYLGGANIDILTGFETKDEYIRDEILGKREALSTFIHGLDSVAAASASLTAYILYKPSPFMTDDDANEEAGDSIDFLVKECKQRGIPLGIRINPMYAAKGSKWAAQAESYKEYNPPRLTDIMRLAEEKLKQHGIKIYIGLSTEGLESSPGTYLYREDYNNMLIKSIKLFNDMKINSFEPNILRRSAPK